MVDELTPPANVAVSSSATLRFVVSLDMAASLALAFWALASVASDAFREHPWFPWATVAYAVCLVASDLGCLGLRARALVARRRLGLVAVLVVLWRGGPVTAPWAPYVVVLWSAAIWIVLLVEGRRVAQVVSQTTGEEVLEVDPKRPRL